MKVSVLGKKEAESHLPLPVFSSHVPAGFPSPADDYIEDRLDLNEHLVRHPDATFYARASGDSMLGVGIHDGALLIVDKAVTPKHGHVVIASVNGELTCKILDIRRQELRAANPLFKSVSITDELDMVIEGVVLHAINPMPT
jgi:DNA polymerase V